MQAHLRGLALAVCCAFVVPGGPGQRARRQHRSVGVQHSAVGLVGDGAQHRLLGRAGLAEQRQCLVGMRGQNHFVEVFSAAGRTRAAGDAHAAGVAFNGLHRRGQALVMDAGDDLVHVVAGTAGDRPPLRPVSHLDQAVVVAKPDHGGHWKLQHLVGRAGPDAAHHGQEIPVAELVGVVFLQQKFGQGLQHLGLGAGLGQRRGPPVKAQDVAQHAPETPVQQVGALRKDAVQAGAAPFHGPALAGGRNLDGKRHVRLGSGHVKRFEQPDQVGVGALVKDQKTGVHAVRQRAVGAGQGHIDRVGVAAKIVAGLEQSDVGLIGQAVCGGQPGNAGADDGHAQPWGPGRLKAGKSHVSAAVPWVFILLPTWFPAP